MSTLFNSNKQSKYRRHLNFNIVKSIFIKIIISMLVIYLIWFLKLPFFVLSAGSADPVKSLVQVEKGDSEESGAFLLTTVMVKDTNLIRYLLALTNPNQELQLKSNIIPQGESLEDFKKEQLLVMENSQQQAIGAAYHLAGIHYSYNIIVVDTINNMPADQILKSGDLIFSIDQKELYTFQDLQDYLELKQVGDSIAIQYLRNGDTKTANLKVSQLPKKSESEAPQIGIGIIVRQQIRMDTIDKDKRIYIQKGNVGGPSAGLMFALEIYNHLTSENITKGYRIAGTGTINEIGEVGVIGGIQHKVLAAEKAKADIFFAPHDLPATNEYESVANYSLARDQANKIGSSMKIVEVSTIQDALNYLSQLPIKVEPSE